MQEKKTLKRKRLVVEMPEEFHKEIKTRATFRGITISDWVIIAIKERIAEEKRRE